jgi:hypothetical protein
LSIIILTGVNTTRIPKVRHLRGAPVRHPRGAQVRHPRGAPVRHPRGANVRHPRGALTTEDLQESVSSMLDTQVVQINTHEEDLQESSSVSHQVRHPRGAPVRHPRGANVRHPR